MLEHQTGRMYDAKGIQRDPYFSDDGQPESAQDQDQQSDEPPEIVLSRQLQDRFEDLSREDLLAYLVGLPTRNLETARQLKEDYDQYIVEKRGGEMIYGGFRYHGEMDLDYSNAF